MKSVCFVRCLPLSIMAILLAVISGCSPADPPPKPVAAPAPARIEIPGVENAFKVTDRIYSGAQPEGDAAFEALASLGIRTIISVDGARPDVEAARKHGLRYVHLPIGYDGVSEARALQLAQAASTISGPVFVHCHHGKHRGPAAVSILCRAAEGWTAEKAESWLRDAGTGPEYPGLYRSVREFQAATKEQLSRAAPLPEVAPTSPLADAMVEIDHHMDALKLAQKHGWAAPADRQAQPPAEGAVILWEHFKELSRSEDTARRSADYRRLLGDAERDSGALANALRSPAPDLTVLAARLKTLAAGCTACHKACRN